VPNNDARVDNPRHIKNRYFPLFVPQQIDQRAF
jgi:hypothetical protein